MAKTYGDMGPGEIYGTGRRVKFSSRPRYFGLHLGRGAITPQNGVILENKKTSGRAGRRGSFLHRHGGQLSDPRRYALGTEVPNSNQPRDRWAESDEQGNNSFRLCNFAEHKRTAADCALTPQKSPVRTQLNRTRNPGPEQTEAFGQRFRGRERPVCRRKRTQSNTGASPNSFQ
jgi:hypothetical protein